MPPPIDHARRGAFQRQVLLLSIGHLLAFVDRTKVVGLLPTIRQQVPMTDTAAGWVLGTAFALGYAVSIAVVTVPGRRRRSGDAQGRLCMGIALWGLASLATGVATSVAGLIAARFVVGVGQALFIPAAVSRLSVDGEAVGKGVEGLSRFTASASLGRSAGLFAIAVALALIGAVGAAPAVAWRWVFALTALPNLALFLLLLRRRGGARSVAAVPAAPGGNRMARLVYMLLVLLPFILTQALGGWLPTLFTQDRGAGTQGGAIWVGAIALVAGTSSQLVAGWLLQRAGRWRGRVPVVIVGALALTIPAIALTGWGTGAIAATVGALLASLILGGATFAALFGWQRLIPEADRLSANGVFFALITVVGVGVGPLLTGMLTDRGLTLRAALLAMTVVFAVAAAALAALAQPRYRRLATP